MYNANDVLLEDNLFDTDGSLLSKTTYEYDSNGNLVRENYYNEEGILWESCELDAEGNYIKDIFYNEDGTVSGAWEYVNGEWIEVEVNG